MSKQYDKEFEENWKIQKIFLKYYSKDGHSPKRHKHSGKMTQAIFIESAKDEAIANKDKKRRLNVSKVFRILGISRNRYYTFKHGSLSLRKQHKQTIEYIY